MLAHLLLIGLAAQLFSNVGGLAIEEHEWQKKVHPMQERKALAPGETYRLIITVKEQRSKAIEGFLREVANPVSKGGLDAAWIPVLQAYEVETSGPKLKRLLRSTAVASAWVVPNDLDTRYGQILRGIAYAIETVPPGGAANVSLGPYVGEQGTILDLEEPMHRLTSIGAERGLTFIFSAGNEGPLPNRLNPWGLAEWTISVGAASADGTELWSSSSRGQEGSASLRPTFVAPGVDMVAPHPGSVPKSSTQIAAEKRVGFHTKVPEEDWPRYTVVTGTSIAAAEGSRCVALLLHFLVNEVSIRAEAEAEMVLQLGFPASRVLDQQRLLGDIKRSGDVQIVTYPLHRPDPRLVKQLLIDIAEPMPGYSPHEVGAGFVSYNIAFQHFGKHGHPETKTPIVKVTDR